MNQQAEEIFKWAIMPSQHMQDKWAQKKQGVVANFAISVRAEGHDFFISFDSG